MRYEMLIFKNWTSSKILVSSSAEKFAPPVLSIELAISDLIVLFRKIQKVPKKRPEFKNVTFRNLNVQFEVHGR